MQYYLSIVRIFYSVPLLKSSHHKWTSITGQSKSCNTHNSFSSLEEEIKTLHPTIFDPTKTNGDLKVLSPI